MTAEPAPGNQASSSIAEPWPPLPLEAWKDTRDTLHMYTQIIGKVRLALAPMEPQWAQVPLHVTSRGLTTGPIPYRDRTFTVDFDLIAHDLVIDTSDGAIRRLALVPRTVARFYDEFMEALGSLGIEVALRTRPCEVPDPIPFTDDLVHRAYDPEQVTRFFHVLARIDVVLKEHRARFWGRASPVAFFWGTFDLSYTRFSGRPAEPPPGSDTIYRLAMNAEQFETGFWPGDDRFPEPAFYAFTYPKPAGIEQAPIEPRAAFWSDKLGEHLLRYDDVRRAQEPADAILAFAESTYRAGAQLAGWDTALLERRTPVPRAA
jgi:hypothetical protein